LDEISAKIYRKDLERLANKLGLVKDDIDEIRDIYSDKICSFEANYLKTCNG
jgi:hypothetical protein